MKTLSLTSALLIATLLSPVAFADQGFYLGLQGGYSDIDTEEEDIVELKSDINAQVYAGYMFTDWIGLELAYSDFGSFEIKDRESEIDYSGIHLGLAFEGKFAGNTKVFAKLGLYDIDTEMDSNDAEGSDTGFFYQAGLAFPVMKHMDITVSWQNYHKIEIVDASVNSGIDAYDVGLRFSF